MSSGGCISGSAPHPLCKTTAGRPASSSGGTNARAASNTLFGAVGVSHRTMLVAMNVVSRAAELGALSALQLPAASNIAIQLTTLRRSGSAGSETIAYRCPANGSRDGVSWLIRLLSGARHEMLAASCTRDMRSSSAAFFRPSASFLSWAASFSFCDAIFKAALDAPSRSCVNSPFFARNLVWRLPLLISTPSSPATPMATSKAPSSSKTNFRVFGDWGRNLTRMKSSRSSWCSHMTKATSSTTPSTTRATNTYSQTSSESIEISRALIEIRRAMAELAIVEESMDHLRRTCVKALAVTLASVVALIFMRVIAGCIKWRWTSLTFRSLLSWRKDRRSAVTPPSPSRPSHLGVSSERQARHALRP